MCRYLCRYAAAAVALFVMSWSYLYIMLFMGTCISGDDEFDQPHCHSLREFSYLVVSSVAQTAWAFTHMAVYCVCHAGGDYDCVIQPEASIVRSAYWDGTACCQLVGNRTFFDEFS
jgi:hypothetical protein